MGKPFQNTAGVGNKDIFGHGVSSVFESRSFNSRRSSPVIKTYERFRSDEWKTYFNVSWDINRSHVERQLSMLMIQS
jgi:hypothetical protein